MVVFVAGLRSQEHLATAAEVFDARFSSLALRLCGGEERGAREREPCVALEMYGSIDRLSAQENLDQGFQ